MSVYVTLLLSPLQYMLSFIFESLNGINLPTVSVAAVATSSSTSGYDFFRSLFPVSSKNSRRFPIKMEDSFCTLYEHLKANGVYNFVGSIDESSNNGNDTILISTEEMYAKFVAEIKLCRNLKLQHNESTDLFDSVWRLDNHGNFLKSNQFKHEIGTANHEASLVLNKLSGCSDINIGVEIVKLFIVDLLKQHPNTKEIFVSKFDDE